MKPNATTPTIEQIQVYFKERNKAKKQVVVPPWIPKNQIGDKLIKEQSSIIYNSKIDSRTLVSCFEKIILLEDYWIRPLNDWKTKSHNQERDLISLINHLFIKYKPPNCLLKDFIYNQERGSFERALWFVKLSNGENLRKQEYLPFPITKMVSHFFTTCPHEMFVEQTFRWAQAKALGATHSQTINIAMSKLGEQFFYWKDGYGHEKYIGEQNNRFWESVISFFIKNVFIDKDWYNRIIDYIEYQKFGGGNQPNFSMNGRTPESLLKQVEMFEKTYVKSNRNSSNRQWTSINLEHNKVYTINNKNEESEIVYIFNELLSESELRAESKTQSHCVWSYAEACEREIKSIFSMVRKDENGNKTKELTIEINRGAKCIMQLAKKYNAKPTKNDIMVVRKWASDNDLKFHYYNY